MEYFIFGVKSFLVYFLCGFLLVLINDRRHSSDGVHADYAIPAMFLWPIAMTASVWYIVRNLNRRGLKK